MDETLEPFMFFGQDVWPFQWFSTQSETGVVVGLFNKNGDPIFANGHQVRVELGLGDLTDTAPVPRLVANPVFGTTYDVDNVDVTGEGSYGFDVTYNTAIDPNGVVTAFDIDYVDIGIGGGSFSIGFGDPFLDPFLGYDITGPLPQFDMVGDLDTTRVFWGGTFVEPTVRDYAGQPNLFDELVLPGQPDVYSIEIQKDGSIKILVNGASDPLFGQEYTGQGIDSILFGDDPQDYFSMSFLEVSVFYGVSSEEINQIALTHSNVFGTTPTINELFFLTKEYVDLGSSVAALADVLTARTIIYDFENVDYTDPANAGTASEFVREVYDTTLAREPDQEGQAFWENALTSGGVSGSDFFSAFVDGVFAATGGLIDQVRFDDIIDLFSRVTLEFGMTDKMVVDALHDEIVPGWSDADRTVTFENAERAFEEATDGDGVDDSLTIHVLGIGDDSDNGGF